MSWGGRDQKKSLSYQIPQSALWCSVRTCSQAIYGIWASWIGLDKLCQHNFENNRYSQEYENNAGIIGKAFCVRATNSIVVFQTTRTLIRRLCFTLYHASVQQKALIFQTTRTLIRRLCFTLYHASVQQKAQIFFSQNMIVFIVYNVE